MSITKLALTYLGSLVAFLIIDLTWLGFIAKGIYNKYLSAFLAPKPNWTTAFIFYALFVVGVLIFCIIPAVQDQSVYKALYLGALFGFFTYATYELTNHAVIANWPLGIVFIDILWGVVLTASVSVVGYYVATLVGLK